MCDRQLHATLYVGLMNVSSMCLKLRVSRSARRTQQALLRRCWRPLKPRSEEQNHAPAPILAGLSAQPTPLLSAIAKAGVIPFLQNATTAPLPPCVTCSLHSRSSFQALPCMGSNCQGLPVPRSKPAQYVLEPIVGLALVNTVGEHGSTNLLSQ